MNSKAQILINLVRAEIAHRTPSVTGDLEAGINFATVRQIGYMNGLLCKAGVPDKWRLWLVGQLIGRQLHESTRELHWAEASSIIDTILADEWEAQEAIGEMLDEAMNHCVAKAQWQNGHSRIIVYEQAAFLS
jgi:hypothetical protein